MTTSRTPLLRKKWPLLALVLAAILALILVIWQLQTSPETNDAYVYADTIDVVPEVSGRIVEMPIRDNQRVKKGDLLVEFDLEEIKKAGYDTTVIYIVTNMDDVSGITTETGKQVNVAEKVMEVRK